MKRTISVVAVVWFSLMLIYSVEAQPEEKQQPPNQETKQPADAQAQTTAQVQVLSTRVVNEVTSSITNQTWTPADPSKNKGITVSVRLERGFGYSAKDFALAFKNSDTEQKVMAIGHASSPGKWLFAKGEAEWSFFPGKMEGKPTIDMGLLFLLPIEVQEVTLIYKDKPVGKPVTIK
ncbi:MAG TPA: hypothetical protein VNO70_06965 [Blastocatellia bacterium]|nr:hypothetical protein [Blastocatellia bacterium]